MMRRDINQADIDREVAEVESWLKEGIMGPRRTAEDEERLVLMRKQEPVKTNNRVTWLLTVLFFAVAGWAVWFLRKELGR